MRTDEIVLVVNQFAGWVMDVELDDSVNVSVSSDGERVIGDTLKVSCIRTSHCDFSTAEAPIPTEGEDDVEFLPYLSHIGQPVLFPSPVEVGGKIRAECRQSGDWASAHRHMTLSLRVCVGPSRGSPALWGEYQGPGGGVCCCRRHRSCPWLAVEAGRSGQ